MTQPGSVSQVTVKAGVVTSLGTIVAGTLIANTSTASAIYVSQSTSVSATNGLRVGPLGSVSWTDSTPCYIAVDGQLDVTVTLSTVSANLSSPLDVADAIHKDGVSISGPVTIDGTVPIDGTVTISAPVTIDGTVPITGTVNANISGPVTVETSAGTALDVNATGTVSLSGPVEVTAPAGTPLDVNATGSVSLTGPVEVTTPAGTPLDVTVPGTVAVSAIQSTVNIATAAPIDVVASGTVNVNPVTIEGTVPVTGTVELGAGTSVSIVGTVDLSGPVTIDGNVTVTNTLSVLGISQQLSQNTYTPFHLGPDTTIVSGYASIIIQIDGSLSQPYDEYITIKFTNGSGQVTTTLNVDMINLSGPIDFVIPNYYSDISVSFTPAPSQNHNYTVTIAGTSTLAPNMTSLALLTSVITATGSTNSGAGEIELGTYIAGKVTGSLTIQCPVSGSATVPPFVVLADDPAENYSGVLGQNPGASITWPSGKIQMNLNGIAQPSCNSVFIRSTNSTPMPDNLIYNVMLTIG